MPKHLTETDLPKMNQSARRAVTSGTHSVATTFKIGVSLFGYYH